MTILTVEPGKPFEWRRGLRLQATEDTQLILPGALWVKGEALGSVIEVSDDEARVTINQADDGIVRRIHVFLRTGEHATLHHNSEAIAIGQGEKQITLNVLEAGNAA